MSSRNTLSMRIIKDLNRIGMRLKTNLSTILNAFPKQARTITGMATWLDISRSTCQRISECARKSKTGTDVILFMPGDSGWQKFLYAVKQHDVDPPEIKRIINLVSEFDEILLNQRMSHNELKKSLASSVNVIDNSSEEVNERAELFKAASKVLGEQKAAKFGVCIVHINPGDEKNVQIHTLIHHERCQISKNSRPVFMPIWSADLHKELSSPATLSLEHDLDRFATEKIAFIEDYTSDHLDTQTINTNRSADAIIINPESTHSEPFDVTMYVHYERDQLRHLRGINHSNSIGLQVRNPCKQLYMVVFIEKGMTANSTPEAGAFAFKRTDDTLVQGSPDDIWYDRFPGALEIEQVNPTINFSSKLKYVKANELINSLFDITKVDRAKYACYMIKVDYPLWSSEYRMYLTYDFKKKKSD